MRESLLYISNNYLKESRSNIKSNVFANFIRYDFTQKVSSYFPHNNYKWVGSPGQGNWAVCPWLAIFNQTITSSAQEGYCPVYLFSTDMNSVYLSMNQGVTQVKNEFGSKEARNILAIRARIMRHRVKEILDD